MDSDGGSDGEIVDLHSQLIEAIEDKFICEVKSIVEYYKPKLRGCVHLDEALVAACKTGCVEIVEILVNGDADIFYSDENGIKPAHHTTRSGHLAVLKYMARENAAALNVVDLNNWTVLHHAADVGDLEITRFILNENARLQMITATDGDLPIHIACARGYLDIVEELVNAGSNVNTSSGKAMATPLMRAVGANHIEVVKYLLSKDASLIRADVQGRRPLLVAAACGFTELLRFIIDQTPGSHVVNMADNNSRTALHMAVAAPNDAADIIQLLIESGARVNTPDKGGMTALHHAAFMEKYDIIELLLRHGAMVNVKDTVKGSTPLSLAVSKGSSECVSILILAGADVNTADDNLVTPLHKIMSLNIGPNRTEVIKTLIQHGAILDSLNSRGYTPLDCCATMSGANRFCMDDLICLVEAGIELSHIEGVRLGGTRHKSPIFWLVSQRNDVEAVTYLVERGWDLSKERWIFLPREAIQRRSNSLMFANRDFDLIGYLRDQAAVPRSLRNLCRSIIRQQLIYVTDGRVISDLIEQLTLPSMLKLYLNMKY